MLWLQLLSNKLQKSKLKFWNVKFIIFQCTFRRGNSMPSCGCFEVMHHWKSRLCHLIHLLMQQWGQFTDERCQDFLLQWIFLNLTTCISERVALCCSDWCENLQFSLNIMLLQTFQLQYCWSWILEGFDTFGVIVTETWVAKLAVPDGDKCTSILVRKTRPGNSYKKSGLSYCLTDCLGLEAAIANDILTEGVLARVPIKEIVNTKSHHKWALECTRISDELDNNAKK